MNDDDVRDVIQRTIEANLEANRRLEQQLRRLGTESPPKNTAALLIGLNYAGTDMQLAGCARDVHRVRDHLVSAMGFSPDTIECVTDEDSSIDLSASGIVKLVESFAKRAAGCDRVWFHFSGHGSFEWDLSGDERDGQDECLVAADGGLISDDILLKRLVLQLPQKSRLVCVIDCCHSGTQLDLRYRYVGGSRSKIVHRDFPYRDCCRAVCLSGCRDTGTSQEVMGEDGTWAGVMTSSLLDHLTEDGNPTCQDLLRRLRASLKHNGFCQVPQMTSTHPISRTTPFIGW